MTTVDVATAANKLSDLVQAAAAGEEVVITRDSHPVARLVSMRAGKGTRRFGSARGEVKLAPDFDTPLSDFAPYMSSDKPERGAETR